MFILRDGCIVRGQTRLDNVGHPVIKMSKVRIGNLLLIILKQMSKLRPLTVSIKCPVFVRQKDKDFTFCFKNLFPLLKSPYWVAEVFQDVL